MYWRLTPVETGALLDSMIEREVRTERAASYRTAFIVAELRNANRTKRTDKVWRPEDFLAGEKREATKLLGPEHLAGALDAFMVRHNRSMQQKAMRP